MPRYVLVTGPDAFAENGCFMFTLWGGGVHNVMSPFGTGKGRRL